MKVGQYNCLFKRELRTIYSCAQSLLRMALMILAVGSNSHSNLIAKTESQCLFLSSAKRLSRMSSCPDGSCGYTDAIENSRASVCRKGILYTGSAVSKVPHCRWRMEGYPR
jgi:hypothetical protein